jgi:Asp-tRNA(Asn)/Glu-tRNA(Gln) amidotransferase A subunit family amidase
MCRLIVPVAGKRFFSNADVAKLVFNFPSYMFLGNLAGVPAISVPMGYTSSGLPLAFQVC